jgi:predicted nucleotidyltransferase
MRTLDDIRQQLQAELPDLRERYNVDRLGICGSYVRGEQTDDSDLDLLVTFTETPGLFEFVGLKHHLEEALGLSVDLGMPDALKEGPAADNIRREVECLIPS